MTMFGRGALHMRCCMWAIVVALSGRMAWRSPSPLIYRN